MNKKFLKDTILVILSNVCVLVSGIVVGICIPKMMSTEEYGNYKIFTLYISYAALLQFGFVNGIYLLYGGVQYSDLPKEKMQAYFRYFIFMQLGIFFAVFLIIGVITYCVTKEFIPQMLIFLIVIESLVRNIIYFFQLLSQAVQKFKQLSGINTIKSFITIIIIGLLYILLWRGEINFVSSNLYMLLYILLDIGIMICYIILYRKIIIGKAEKSYVIYGDLLSFHKVGLPLLIGGMLANLLLVLDRQFVSMFFPKEVYGVYSFAYSMLNLISVLITSVAVLIYPTLKQLKKEDVIKKYTSNVMYISILVSICLCIYFPLKEFIYWFLPNYADSVEVFKIILPGLGLSCSISVVLSNYYKVLDEIKKYTQICFVILVIAIINNMLAYAINRTTIAISEASIATIIIWYWYAESYLAKKYLLCVKHNFIFNIFTIACFYISTSIKNNMVGFFAYIISMCIAILIRIFYEKKLRN